MGRQECVTLELSLQLPLRPIRMPLPQSGHRELSRGQTHIQRPLKPFGTRQTPEDTSLNGRGFRAGVVHIGQAMPEAYDCQWDTASGAWG
jgi:hypothetical protein